MKVLFESPSVETIFAWAAAAKSKESEDANAREQAGTETPAVQRDRGPPTLGEVACRKLINVIRVSVEPGLPADQMGFDTTRRFKDLCHLIRERALGIISHLQGDNQC